MKWLAVVLRAEPLARQVGPQARPLHSGNGRTGSLAPSGVVVPNCSASAVWNTLGSYTWKAWPSLIGESCAQRDAPSRAIWAMIALSFGCRARPNNANICASDTLRRPPIRAVRSPAMSSDDSRSRATRPATDPSARSSRRANHDRGACHRRSQPAGSGTCTRHRPTAYAALSRGRPPHHLCHGGRR